MTDQANDTITAAAGGEPIPQAPTETPAQEPVSAANPAEGHQEGASTGSAAPDTPKPADEMVKVMFKGVSSGEATVKKGASFGDAAKAAGVKSGHSMRHDNGNPITSGDKVTKDTTVTTVTAASGG